MPHNPASDEIKRFIQSAGRRQALKQLQKIRFRQDQHNSINFGAKPDTPPILSISRNPDSIFYAQERLSPNPRYILIQRNGKSPFHQAWNLIASEAYYAIHQAAAKFAESAEHHTPINPLTIYRLSQQEATVAAGISQRTGSNPDPNAIGNAAVQNFLGPQNVKSALHCAGYNATISHLNQIIIQSDSLIQATSQDPRAAALWLHLKDPLPLQPVPAKQILQEGRTLLSPNASETELERLWRYAHRLSLKLFQLRPRHLQNLIHDLIRLTSGHPPAYTIAKSLLENFRFANNQCPDTIAYITYLAHQSTLPPRKRTTGSIRLSATTLSNPQYIIKQSLRQYGGDPQAAHQSLLSQETQKPPTKPKSPKPLTKEQNAARKHRSAQLRTAKLLAMELLSLPEIAQSLNQFANLYPPVISIPGQFAELHDSARPGRIPRTALIKQPNGSILTQGPGRTDAPLPTPANPHHPGWSSTNAATMLRTDALQSIPQLQNLPHQSIANDHRFDHAFPPSYHPETIDQLWLQAVQSMINPQVITILQLAAPDPHNESTSLSRYNRTAASLSPLSQILRSNPGAAAWFIAIPRPQPTPPPTHPGQIIATVRQEFQQNGGQHWKSMASMNPQHAARFTFPQPSQPNQETPAPAHKLAAYANILHEAGGPPPQEILLQDIADAINDASAGCGILRQGHALSLIAQETTPLNNLARILTLFIKEARRPNPPSTETLRHQTFQVADYLIARRPQPISATTWRGLLRKAQRWHRRTIQLENERKRLNSLLKNNGLYRNWNSALPPSSQLQNGFIATHANNEGALADIGKSMNNCLGNSYAEQCLTHKTRIFQVHQENQPPTNGVICQLSLNQNQWIPAQIAGYQNRTPTPQETEACQELAQLYTQAYRRTNRKSHDKSSVNTPNPNDPAYQIYLQLAQSGELDNAINNLQNT